MFSFASETNIVSDTFSSDVRHQLGGSIRDLEAGFRSQGESIREPIGFLDGIRDSTEGVSRDHGRVFWDIGNWGSYGACSASKPSCGSQTGVTLTNYGRKYRYRNVDCMTNNLDSSKDDWSDSFCSLAGLSKPNTSSSTSCSRSTTCAAAPSPPSGGGGGGGGGGAPSGTVLRTTSYLCSSSDSGYTHYTYPSTSSYRSKIVSAYRSFSAINRCPEQSGYRYWLDALAKNTQRDHGGNMSAAWPHIKDSMIAAAKKNRENLYSFAKTAADKDCTTAAQTKYGSSVTARYSYNSGNRCIVD
jgi:hypothetical protein